MLCYCAQIALLTVSAHNLLCSGWVDVMWHSVNAVGEDDQPVRDHAPALCLYYMLFLVLGNFFVLNLFIGVIVDSFNTSASGIHPPSHCGGCHWSDCGNRYNGNR